MERLLAITHTRRLFRSMAVLERDYLLSTSADERAGMDKKMAGTDNELLGSIDRYAALMPTGDDAAIESIRGARTRWLERDTLVREAARHDQSRALMLAAQHSSDPISWEAIIGALVKANETRLTAQVAATHASYITACKTLLGVSALAVLLAAGFGYAIFFGIRKNIQQVVELNVNLEALVKARTEALAARERSLRLVLDSTGEGIIGVRNDGTLAGDSSAAAARWFGKAELGNHPGKYLFPNDPVRDAGFAVALDQLLDGILPREITLEQMPRRAERDGVVVDLEYKQVSGDAEVVLLILARDVTARVQSEQAEQEVREQQGLVGKLLADRVGFANFVSEVERLLRSLDTADDPLVVCRDLHTLKGNVAIFGLGSLAGTCHRLEDRLADSGGTPTPADVAELRALFLHKMNGIDTFLTGLDQNSYEVKTGEYAVLIGSLMRRLAHEEILQMVEVWTWPRASELLARLRAQVEYLAQRLEKQVQVTVEHNDLRLPSDYLQSFWPSLCHVIRNAVDHGIETADLRIRHGKSAQGLIALRTWETEDNFYLEVADDGCGIDKQALLRAARSIGLQVPSDADLVDLVFVDGLSTRSQVTDVSGRGVGLSATRDACEAEGGQVDVFTEAGKGTRFVFRFCRPVVDRGAVGAELERGWRLLSPPSVASRLVRSPNSSSWVPGSTAGP
jgi:signal transduction histidine kinase